MVAYNHSTMQRIDPIRIAMVEDDPEFSDALKAAVGSAVDMCMAGHAESRAAGLALLDGPPASVLLVDLGLPDGSGVDVIDAAVRKWPGCGIMVSTTFGDETHVVRSIEAGAVGYLLKDSSPARMLGEIRSLASGGSPISPIIARQLLSRFRAGPSPSPSLSPPPSPSRPVDEGCLLSAREKEVLELITKGYTANEVAELMSLSPFTVRSFVRRIYSKLNVTSKAEAIFEARAQGLLGH